MLALQVIIGVSLLLVISTYPSHSTSRKIRGRNFLKSIKTSALPEQNHILIVKFAEQAIAHLNIQEKYNIMLTGLNSIDTLNYQYNASKLERIFRPAGKFEARHIHYGLHRYYKLTIESEENVESIINEYIKNSNVEYVQLNRKYALRDKSIETQGMNLTPDDPYFSDQWNYYNTGQTGGTPGSDIHAPAAWDIETGDPEVIVSDLDTGIDLDHPDLIANIWVNPGEIPDNGIDDDNNGYIDDVNGWDFADNDNNVDDTNGHGTHTAGTIAAVTSNGIGVSGVAGGSGSGGCKVMVCKIFTDESDVSLVETTDEEIFKAFIYAADNGAIVSNNSWGYKIPGPPSPTVEEGIDYFLTTSGGVVAFAAGNDNTADPTWGYPASYSPVIAVAATDHKDIKAGFSNYGAWVDVSAPGVNIWSTMIDNTYEALQGTSMACPHVAGIAALLFSAYPSWTGAQVRAKIEAGVDNIDALNPGFVGLLGSGRVNAYYALVSDPIPNPPKNLAAEVVNDNDVELTWIDPTKNIDGSAVDLDYIKVFRDEIKIAEVATEAQTYLDKDLPSGFYTYKASAVSKEGYESIPGNEASADVGELAPHIDFIGTPTSGPNPLPVTFKATNSGGEVTGWAWSFGDGASSAIQNPDHTYTQTGSFRVKLKATGPGGYDTEIKSNYITVFPPPDIDFEGIPTSGAAPLTVFFNAESSGGAVTDWFWEFGDGHSSTQENPEYVYTYPGSYMVTLTASGPGGSSVKSKPDYITVAEMLIWQPFEINVTSDQAIQAALTANGKTSIITKDITLYNLSQFEAVFAIMGISPYRHVILDGSNEASVLESYILNGGHVYMEGADIWYWDPLYADGYDFGPLFRIAPLDDGFGDLETIIGKNFALGMDFTYSGLNNSIDQLDCLDGGFVIHANQTPAYNCGIAYNSGDYKTIGVSFAFSGLDDDNAGDSTKAELMGEYLVFFTSSIPLVNFVSSPPIGEAPLIVQFNPTNKGGPVNAWHWDFGDGTTSNEVNPSHLYTQPGKYTVTMTAGGPGGIDTEIKKNSIIVIGTAEAPQVDFVGNPTSGLSSLKVDFSATNSGGPVNDWHWGFGDGETSNEINPSHIFSAPGNYTISLVAYGLGGNDTETKINYIIVMNPQKAPEVNFVGNPTKGEAPLTVSFSATNSGGTATDWHWEFGDEATSNGINPTHIYNALGSYTVTLTANGPGGVDTETKNNYIEVTTANIAELTGKWDYMNNYFSGKLIFGAFEVSNIGTNSADTFKVGFYLSADKTASGALLQETTLRRGLQKGKSKTIRFRHFSRDSLLGNNIIIIIDSTNQIHEADTINNKIIKEII